MESKSVILYVTQMPKSKLSKLISTLSLGSMNGQLQIVDLTKQDLNTLAMFLFRQDGVFCSEPDIDSDHCAVQAVFGDLWARYTVAELRVLLVNLTASDGGAAS